MSVREATAERETALAVGPLVALTKQRQTLLLLVTGAGAYALTLPGSIRWPELAVCLVALWSAISGCTALNMVLDRDLDAKMPRTSGRPLPAGEVTVEAAVALGCVLSAVGLSLSWALGVAFGAIVTLGFIVDIVVYTAWLKRRTPFSILLGGVSGGMPALAGRSLALGHPDAVGALLALAVLLWIPAHILTLAICRVDEYRSAGVPVWPDVYGRTATRRVIAAATLAGAVTLLAAGAIVRIGPYALTGLAGLGVALSALAVAGLLRPSERHDRLLFKAASVYMTAAFAFLVAGAVFGGGG